MKSSLEQAIENSKELIDFFKDKWTEEELNRQILFLEAGKVNLSTCKNEE